VKVSVAWGWVNVKGGRVPVGFGMLNVGAVKEPVGCGNVKLSVGASARAAREVGTGLMKEPVKLWCDRVWTLSVGLVKENVPVG
jgi:hypothetical protein